MRDLTPTKVTEGLWVDSNVIKNSGGGEAFLSFIEKELMPHIDSLYPTTSYRMLIGHSLGGLLVIQSLIHHKNLFSSYVAIDPSMWWDKQNLLHETEQALKSSSYVGISIFLGMAHTQPGEMDTASVQKDTTSGTFHARSIIRLSRSLLNNPQNELQTDFKYYSEETHTSSPLMATYDAIHFIFKDYPLKFQDGYFTDSTFKLATFIKQYYARLNSKYGVKAKDGTTLLPPEEMVNNLGHFALTKGQFSKAKAMFTMNAGNYPSNPAVYAALGDLCAAMHDNLNALSNYKKSLSIKEDTAIRKKVEILTNK